MARRATISSTQFAWHPLRGHGIRWAVAILGCALALAVLLPAAARRASATDPGLSGVSDILNGRRTLLTTDDLVVTDSAWNSNSSTDAKDALLYTAEGTVSGAQSQLVRSATCGVDTAYNGANKAFPQQTRIARLLDQKNDVVVSIFASNNASGDGCQGSSNLALKAYDALSDEVVGTAFYTFATLDWLVSTVADFDGDGLDDILVMNGDKAMVFSAPYAGSTNLRNSTPASTGASRTPMGEPVVGDFNGDGLLDVAWPAATLTNGSPDGSPVVVRFATVCPGSVSGTICDGADRFRIIFDPLASKTLTLTSTTIVWERYWKYDSTTKTGCILNSDTSVRTTLIPLVALAAGKFRGADRDDLFAAYADFEQDCDTKQIQAAAFQFDDDMTPTLASTHQLTNFDVQQNPTKALYATRAALNWFGHTDQVVVAWPTIGIDSNDHSNYPYYSDTNVSVITFDGSLTMTNHDAPAQRTTVSDGNLSLLRGLAVGRFADLSSSASASDFNPQIAVLAMSVYQSKACTSSSGTPTSYVYIYTLDAFSGDYTPELTATYQPCLGFNATTLITALSNLDNYYDIFYTSGIFRGWNTGGSLLRAGDLQGRSVRVGTPLVLRESSHSQPFVILGAPPSHVDYVQTAGASAPAVVNFSALPTAFTAQFDTTTQDSNQSSSTQTTSYTNARMNSDSFGVKLDIPVAGSVLGTISQSTSKTYENVVSNEYDTYTASSFDISTTTQGDDYLWFNASEFNAYFYPVVGQNVCSGDTTECSSDEEVPLVVAFSGPEESRTEAIAATVVEWYQPVEEPLQIFSYPWNEDQLTQRLSDTDVLSQPLAFFTDNSAVAESLQWSSSQGSNTTSGATTTHSKDGSRSITTGSPDLTQAEGSDSSHTVSMSYSKSSSLATLNTDVTVAGASSGIEIVKPDTFANPRLYAYLVAPYIVGQTASSGTVQDLSTNTDVSTTGAIQVAYVADPTDANAGSWWEGGTYAQYVDVALNHPARWNVYFADHDDTVQGAECLLNTDRFTVSCARINQPDPSDLWNSEFYWLRGLMITVGSTDGPQRTQATAGESIFLTARVYNYSLKSMPSGSTVHVRFYRQPWDTETQSAAGDSVLIAENVLDPIPPFNSSADPSAANWVLTSTSLDTTGMDGETMLFWVVTWAEDSAGGLLGELPGHGLAAKPGTLTSIADVPLEQSTYTYQDEQVTSSFSNNVGFFHLAFYVAPATQTAGAGAGGADVLTTSGDDAIGDGTPAAVGRPKPPRGRLVVERLVESPIAAKLGEKVPLRAHVRSSDGERAGVMVTFYDGDPDQGGTAFDVELLAHVPAARRHLVSVPYRPRTCGEHEIVIVANRGKVDEARTTVPVMANCDAAVSTPTVTPSGAPTPTVSTLGGSGGGCALGASATSSSVWFLLIVPLLCAVRVRRAKARCAKAL